MSVRHYLEQLVSNQRNGNQGPLVMAEKPALSHLQRHHWQELMKKNEDRKRKGMVILLHAIFSKLSTNFNCG